MRTIHIESLPQLGTEIGECGMFANGKNHQVDHLHATAAESRWGYENIHGIYLTNESYAWMAVWMAIASREAVRKRDLRYIRPELPEDQLGSLEIFSGLPKEELMHKHGYVYLFDPAALQQQNGRVIDITQVPKNQKVDALLGEGFSWNHIERHGRQQEALVDESGNPNLILVDAWQVAVTNTPAIIPAKELVISGSAVTQLAGRIALTEVEIEEDYIC